MLCSHVGGDHFDVALLVMRSRGLGLKSLLRARLFVLGAGTLLHCYAIVHVCILGGYISGLQVARPRCQQQRRHVQVMRFVGAHGV